MRASAASNEQKDHFFNQQEFTKGLDKAGS